jgi:hypothetical protein
MSWKERYEKLVEAIGEPLSVEEKVIGVVPTVSVVAPRAAGCTPMVVPETLVPLLEELVEVRDHFSSLKAAHRRDLGALGCARRDLARVKEERKKKGERIVELEKGLQDALEWVEGVDERRFSPADEAEYERLRKLMRGS